MKRILKIFTILGLVIAAGLPVVTPAQARVFVGVGVGFPGYYHPYYPGYYPAYSPPAYYAPPPVVYYPPAPTYTYAPAPAPASNCRQFNGDASVDASGQPFYGTACYGADGRWHITQ